MTHYQQPNNDRTESAPLFVPSRQTSIFLGESYSTSRHKALFAFYDLDAFRLSLRDRLHFFLALRTVAQKHGLDNEFAEALSKLGGAERFMDKDCHSALIEEARRLANDDAFQGQHTEFVMAYVEGCMLRLTPSLIEESLHSGLETALRLAVFGMTNDVRVVNGKKPMPAATMHSAAEFVARSVVRVTQDIKQGPPSGPRGSRSRPGPLTYDEIWAAADDFTEDDRPTLHDFAVRLRYEGANPGDSFRKELKDNPMLKEHGHTTHEWKALWSELWRFKREKKLRS